MKKILLSLLFAFMAYTVVSQNYTVNFNGENVSNSEFNVNGISSTEYIKVVLNITNNSSAPINIKVRRNVRNNIEGSINLFCLGNCYDPSVSESPVHLTVLAGATTGENDFYVQFFPEGNTGTAKIKYDVFNADNPEEVVSVTVNFVITTTGINSLYSNASLSVSGLLNQQGMLRVGYSLPSAKNGKIFITNILGVRVAEIILNDRFGNIELPVASLPKGIYICSLQTDGKVLTAKKFVVN